jgi:hypothetical protein
MTNEEMILIHNKRLRETFFLIHTSHICLKKIKIIKKKIKKKGKKNGQI